MVWRNLLCKIFLSTEQMEQQESKYINSLTKSRYTQYHICILDCIQISSHIIVEVARTCELCSLRPSFFLYKGITLVSYHFPIFNACSSLFFLFFLSIKVSPAIFCSPISNVPREPLPKNTIGNKCSYVGQATSRNYGNERIRQ